MTNALNRLAMLKDPANTVDVFSAADLPPSILAPDGAMRSPLVGSTRYVVHESFAWPRLLIPTFPGGSIFEVVTIEGIATDVFMFVSGNTTAQIWGRDNVSLFISTLTMVDISNAGVGNESTLFDLVGTLDTTPPFSLTTVAMVNFANVGQVVDMPLRITRQTFGAVLQGYTARTTPFREVSVAHSVLQTSWLTDSPGQDKPGFILQGASITFSFIGGNIGLLPGDPIFMIDQSSTAEHDITAVVYPGLVVGDFFRPDVSQSLSAMADVSKSITAFADLTNTKSVSSVAAGTIGSVFTTTVAHGFRFGDSVVQSGFSNGSYNGTFTITSIVSTTEYQVAAITFISTDTGTSIVNEVQVDSAAHTLVRGQTVRIANTANYDGLRLIKSVAADEDSFVIGAVFVITETGDVAITRVTTTADTTIVKGETISITGTTSYNITDEETLEATSTTFDIPVLFVADDATGTVTSASQNETTVGLCVSNSGFQPDSKSIGSMHVNGNSTATTISLINTWTDANLAASAVVSSNIERWSLTNTTTGELRYDGNQRFSGVALVSLSGEGEPGNDDYEFRIVVNGSPTSDIIVASTSTNNALRNVGLVVPLTLVSGDLVRLQVQNTTGADDFTFAEVSMNIQ